jgi:hypothetical protein
MSHEAHCWQKRAREIRAEAEKINRSEDKRELPDLAAGYDQLARERSAPANVRARTYQRLAHRTQDGAGRVKPRSRGTQFYGPRSRTRPGEHFKRSRAPAANQVQLGVAKPCTACSAK